MYVLIDNYDSFTYNLLHFLGELGAEVAVYRNDSITPEEVLDLGPEGIVLSPGPCDPDRAGICVDLVGRAVGKVPVLGVCLGHQSIAQAFGANIGRAPILMHGKVSNIRHFGTDIFKDIQSPFSATRYHSLIVENSRLPNCLEVTAESDDGLIMGLSHKEYPIFGVQFHPESIASENGHELLNNFLKITKNGENN
jgi:anthranilate synthase/aminodeoxychorismate synthase-like glutamine amidotransferase